MGIKLDFFEIPLKAMLEGRDWDSKKSAFIIFQNIFWLKVLLVIRKAILYINSSSLLVELILIMLRCNGSSQG